MSSPIADLDSAVVEVARHIRSSGARTRQSLAEATGMGRNTISHLVSDAVEAGLIAPSGSAPSTGGRAAATWRFSHESGAVLVAGVHGSTVHLGVTDLAGNSLEGRVIAWPISNGPRATLDLVAAELRRMAAGVEVPVWAMGVSLPGPIDHATGRPTAPPIMPGWDGFDIVGRLQDLLAVPVAADNDVNTMLIGYAAGAARQPGPGAPAGADVAVLPGDLLYLHAGTGIGAGLMSGGRVHRGAVGAAGDIGHVRVSSDNAVVCRCGRQGCLEAVAGGWALLRDAQRAAVSGLSPCLAARLEEAGSLAPEDLTAGAKAGDTECLTLMGRSASAVGEALAMLVSFFNPARVVLAGPLPEGYPRFEDTVRRLVAEQALDLAIGGLQIVTSADRTADERRGCAVMAVDAVLDGATV